jgi:hypothetical protein
VVQHEYIESRFWQVVGAPEHPSDSTITAWKTWYPYDKQSSSSDDDSTESFTQISTSSAELDEVWELCR